MEGMATIRLNQRWFISIGNSALVHEVIVLEITGATVLVQFTTNEDTFEKFGFIESAPVKARYRWEKVLWIERLPKNSRQK